MPVTGGNIHELFREEQSIYEEAKADLNSSDVNEKLHKKYKKLTESYGKLLSSCKKIFRISDMQGKELKRCENEMKLILDNSDQGFLTFGKDLVIKREYSAECIKIFNKKIANMNILELLAVQNSGTGSMFEDVFTELFATADESQRLVLTQKLPDVIRINDKFINIKYKYINRQEYGNDKDVVMLILTDITDKQKAEDQVLYLSYHDKLTSLFNRAYVDSVVPQLRTQENLPLSIIIADMNGLKLTNDVFGHEKGDQLLKKFAGVLNECCRKSDIVARWGGDEFLIFLPGTSSFASEKICSRIKAVCAETEPDPITLSVSLGTATAENLDTDISELFSVAENIMYGNKLMEGRAVRKSIIFSMGRILHEKCFEYYDHTERIKKNALRFSEFLNMDRQTKESENLLLLAVLHDIGKVSIPKEILGKPGPLTQNEWKIMQSHTETGFRMAQSIEEPALAQAILAMRERWDGKGYPYGLKGEQIPMITRIISIIDAYDVMTHDRPYKKAISRENALKELMNGSRTQFDPDLVKAFVNRIEEIL